MRQKVWSGPLPRYWVESPWWSDADGDLILLTPSAEGRLLRRIRADGQTLWERAVVASLIVVCADGVVLTARVRDQRSDAGYYQFMAVLAATGELLWELPLDVMVALPKGGVPQFPLDQAGAPAVRLDQWRRLRDGSPVEVESRALQRGEWSHRSTTVVEGPQGLTVNHGQDGWAASDLRLRDLLGVTGGLLVGTERSTALWARDLRTGQLCWRVEYDAFDVVVPSERVAGLEAECWNYASTVPVAGVVKDDQVLMLQEASGATELVSWPKQTVVDRWAAAGTVVLLGLVGSYVLALEEYEDGMGCLWLLR